MNVFISIIEEAYVSSKTKDRSHWIYSYLKVDPNYIEIKQDGKKADANKKAEIQIENEQNQEDDKIKQKVQTENTIREILNTKQEEVFEEKKKQDESPKEKLKDKESEVIDLLTKSFKNCDNLLDDIENLIPEIKGASKENSLEEFNKILQENVILINEKINYIQYHWQDK